MTNDELMKAAIAAYSEDKPVIVFSSDRRVCHCSDPAIKQRLSSLDSTNEMAVAKDLILKCTIVKLGFKQAEFETTDGPEIFEAARLNWLRRN
jgi:hypothetical protein